MRRHAPGSVKVHLKYGQVTLRDVKKACDDLEDSAGKSKYDWSRMPTRKLKTVREEIEKELKKRKSCQ